MTNLTAVIIGNPDDDARIPQWREGVVTQVSPLLVRVGSAVTSKPCNALASYAPRVGDAVSVLVLSGDRLVLGTVATTAQVWTALPLVSPWAIYGGGWMPPQYRKIGDIVYLRGLLQRGTGATSNVAVLPVGYRPTVGTEIFGLLWSGTSGIARVDIDTGGNITAAGTTDTNWLSLAGVQFSVT